MNHINYKGCALFVTLTLVNIVFIITGIFDPNINLSLMMISIILFYYYISTISYTSVVILPFLLLWLLELIGGLFLNSLEWADEVFLHINADEKFSLLGILYLTFMVIIFLTLNRSRYFDIITHEKPTPTEDVSNILRFGLLIGGVGAAIILITYIRLGFPLLDGRERLEFESDSKLFNYVMRYRVSIMLMLGVVLHRTRSKTIGMIIASYLILSILGSDRITYPLMMMSFFVVGYCLSQKSARIPPAAFIAIIISAIVVAYFFLISRYGNSFDEKLGAFARRISLQGQAWALAAASDFPLYDVSIDHIYKEIQNLLFGAKYKQWEYPLLGAWYYLVEYLPKNDQMLWRMDKSNSLIMMFYPYILEIYGLIPVILANFMLAGYTALTGHFLLKSIYQEDVVSITLSSILLQGSVFCVISGDFGQILGKWQIIIWIILMFKLNTSVKLKLGWR